jgi:L-ascorbate metabolism protein UlaG (beta-lactamase superfamily)
MKKIFVGLLFMIIGSCGSSYKGAKSDHFDGKRFHNPTGAPPKGLWHVFKWKMFGAAKPWPQWIENQAVPQLSLLPTEREVIVTFINHAMVLLQFKNLTILTDPHLSERTSPVSWAGPKRVRRPGVSFDELPKIDVIAISHNHYDHLDIPTLQKISKRDQPRIFIPLGDGALLEKNQITNFQELDWWEEVVIAPGFKVIFTPCHHWSARGVFDRNKSLWGSFTFDYLGAKIHFGGDTGYSDHFKMIYAKLGAMSFSMLPIGAYEPRWMMKEQHLNPEEAVQAHLDLKSKKSMGIHFGTFQLTDEGIDDPVSDLKKALKKMNVPENEFITLEVGETQRISL